MELIWSLVTTIWEKSVYRYAISTLALDIIETMYLLQIFNFYSLPILVLCLPQSTLHGFLRGLRDSIAGFGLIFTYDAQVPSRDVSSPPQETSLARRRAALQAEKKQKHAEQKELVLWRILAGSNVHDSRRSWYCITALLV